MATGSHLTCSSGNEAKTSLSQNLGFQNYITLIIFVNVHSPIPIGTHCHISSPPYIIIIKSHYVKGLMSQ